MSLASIVYVSVVALGFSYTPVINSTAVLGGDLDRVSVSAPVSQGQGGQSQSGKKKQAAQDAASARARGFSDYRKPQSGNSQGGRSQGARWQSGRGQGGQSQGGQSQSGQRSPSQAAQRARVWRARWNARLANRRGFSQRQTGGGIFGPRGGGILPSVPPQPVSQFVP